MSDQDVTLNVLGHCYYHDAEIAENPQHKPIYLNKDK